MNRQRGTRKKKRGLGKTVLVWSCLLLLPLLLAVLALEQVNRTPRELAPYIERRAAGHNPVIVGIGAWAGKILRALDRMEPVSHPLPTLSAGVQPAYRAISGSASGREVEAGTVEQALLAIRNAQPGDDIVLLPGVYRFSGNNIIVSNPGQSSARITVKARQAGTVKLELSSQQGFIVSAPYWTFENLHLRGVCATHTDCEHAFHVTGEARHFVARNNTILDFNAHFKINSHNGQHPDDGLIEQNTLSNSAIRDTRNPVTVIDVVGASRWRIRRNLISDFIKGGSDRISYGAFTKGAGGENVIEQNIVICEHRLHGAAGQRVGLSLGGGGTGPQFCRDQRCITEQDRSVIDSNLVMSCSDDGIYLNKAAASRVSNNTLLDTGGIEVRYAESSADVTANLVDGKIRAKEGGLMHASDNLDTSMTSLYLGRHPVRARFRNPAKLDLSWNNKPDELPRGLPVPTDLCGTQRSAQSPAGAFDDFAGCLGHAAPAKP